MNLLKVSLILGCLATQVLASQNEAGIIAIAEGQSFLREGKVIYSRPEIGATVRVNQFGQYRDVTPIPARADFSHPHPTLAQPNDVVLEGAVLQTYVDGFIKLLLKNDTVVDIGPSSVIQVEKFEKTHIVLKALQGSFRVIIAANLDKGENFFVQTPNTDLRVRGTEFIINATPTSSFAYKNETFTEVLCVHGQVLADVPRQTLEGLVYLQSYVLRPSTLFHAQGANGFGHVAGYRYISQDELRGQVRKLSPLVNVLASYSGLHPSPYLIPGTGLTLRKTPKNRSVASNNFNVPQDLDLPPTSVWWLPDGRPGFVKEQNPMSDAGAAAMPTTLQQIPIQFKRGP